MSIEEEYQKEVTEIEKQVEARHLEACEDNWSRQVSSGFLSKEIKQVSLDSDGQVWVTMNDGNISEVAVSYTLEDLNRRELEEVIECLRLREESK